MVSPHSRGLASASLQVHDGHDGSGLGRAETSMVSPELSPAPSARYSLAAGHLAGTPVDPGRHLP